MEGIGEIIESCFVLLDCWIARQKKKGKKSMADADAGSRTPSTASTGPYFRNESSGALRTTSAFLPLSLYMALYG
jgi:hypothetical protein